MIDVTSDNSYYVYLHTKVLSDRSGDVFYVGMGCGERCNVVHQRNDKWEKIYKKYGRRVIIYKENLSKHEAYNIEVNLIALFRKSGFNLANITSGGEGADSKKVYCSNGLSFSAISLAAVWISRSLGRKVSSSHISSCALGKLRTAHGFSWSFISCDDALKSLEVKTIRYNQRKIFCSNGSSFDSVSLAVKWVRSNGFPKGQMSTILSSMKYYGRSAYGLAWSYDGVPSAPLGKKLLGEMNFGRSILCSNGIVFASISKAEGWLRVNGYPNASTTNIIKNAKGRSKTAYGYKWKYVENEDET